MGKAQRTQTPQANKDLYDLLRVHRVDYRTVPVAKSIHIKKSS